MRHSSPPSIPSPSLPLILTLPSPRIPARPLSSSHLTKPALCQRMLFNMESPFSRLSLRPCEWGDSKASRPTFLPQRTLWVAPQFASSVNVNDNHMLRGFSPRCQTLTQPVTVPPLCVCVCFAENLASRLTQLDLENLWWKQKQIPSHIVLPSFQLSYTPFFRKITGRKLLFQMTQAKVAVEVMCVWARVLGKAQVLF